MAALLRVAYAIVPSQTHSDSIMMSSVQRNCRQRTMVVILTIVVLSVLFTILYWSTGDFSAGQLLEKHFKFSKAAQSLDTEYHTCAAQPGAIKRGVLSALPSYRARPATNDLDLMKKMLINRLTDDYCYCKRMIPSHTSPAFLNNTRNPCWWENGSMQCLPYFYIIGFSKCATTDMYSNLVWHPSVISGQKEPHWIDYLRFVENRMYLQNYTAHFKDMIGKIEMSAFSKGYSHGVFGDATPCTAWYSLYWPCFQGNQLSLQEPEYTNADVVHRMVPTAKIIVMIRDPIDRLYSRYLTWRMKVPHAAYQRPSPEAFHKLCVHAVALYQQCLKQGSPRQCAYNGTLYTQVILRLQEGMYSVFLKDWIRVFPKRQILLVSFEHYIKYKVETVSAVWSFLELEPAPEKTLDKLRKKAPVNNQNNVYETVGDMLPETRSLLEQFYKPFQEELLDMIKTGTFTLARDLIKSL
ncbi:hypothetical protein RRG08_064335 [Elysia crispata]|uniref:Sulfotransferase domain-containing protein n=1 Tax=Elysia crispata TaxID=231223 RepID=A0AAE0ZJ17_9GAST|nr:hypothetical protein RRG08_064335 [Elysia crispata]